MVNVEMSNVTGAGAEARAAERRLILSYAQTSEVGVGVAALLDLDDTLADVLRHVSEPMIAQMRLTWWHDAVSGLDSAPPPAQPVLRSLAAGVVGRGISGTRVAALVEGWETLLDGDPADPEVRERFAAERGGRLFALAAELAGGGNVDAAGKGWAMADLARSVTDPAIASAAAADARVLLEQAMAVRWARPLRVLGALAHQAAMDLLTPLDRLAPVATPRRIGRLAWHRLTGR